MIESLPLAVRRFTTLQGVRALTNATGFFFERDGTVRRALDGAGFRDLPVAPPEPRR